MDYKLKDLIEIKHGHAFKSEYFSEEPTENILLSPGNVSIGGGFNLKKKKYYREDVEINNDYIFSVGDIFITMTDLSKDGDTLGFPAKIPEDIEYNLLHNQRLGKVILKKEELLDLDFLYYSLCTREYRGYILGTATGSTVKHTSPTKILDYKLTLPELYVQKKISRILSNLDKKILVNNKIIELLEQLSQTLFKHWFIDFEFPNEEGKPYKSSGGEMVESELGEIPKGWKVTFLHEHVDFLSGGTPKTTVQEYWNGSIPFFTPKDAKLNIYTTITEKTITSLGLEKCNSKLYPKNTLFITARGTVGKLALANKAMAMNQSCFALKHKENKQFYLYHVVENLVREIILGANGAVFNAINLNDLNRLKYAYSNNELISNFEMSITKIYDQISLLEEENLSLNQLRDALLPKLLSGELEIPEKLEV